MQFDFPLPADPDPALTAVQGPALKAAIDAIATAAQQDALERDAVQLELQQARYEADLAQRRNEAVDPAESRPPSRTSRSRARDLAAQIVRMRGVASERGWCAWNVSARKVIASACVCVGPHPSAADPAGYSAASLCKSPQVTCE